MLELKIKLEGIKEALKLFDPAIVRKASNRALQRIGRGTMSHIAKDITSRYSIKSGDVRRSLKFETVREAGAISSVAIVGTGLGLPLVYFQAKQEGVSGIKGGGYRYSRRAGRTGNLRHGGQVTVSIRKGHRTPVRPKYGQPAFMPILGRHRAVFERETKKRLPIRERFGPGVAGLMKSRALRTSVERYVKERWAKEFYANLSYYQGQK